MDGEGTVVDHVIFGGGIAGLWLLDELRRAGFGAVLLESSALGAGQTIWSQGIIHGGVKYTLDGLLNPSANAIRDMPTLWRECLAGRREPDLSGARLRSDHCYLWQTDSLSSKLGMIGARVGLRTASETIADAERPPALRSCPGCVAKVGEPVLDTGSVLARLAARNAGAVLRYDAESLTTRPGAGGTRVLSIRDPVTGARAELRVAGNVYLTAGNGNARLARRLGVPGADAAMQVRALHMVMVRGDASILPELYGHCVDGARTRVTITSALDSEGRRVWQVGGEIAERGVRLGAAGLIELAESELRAVLPEFPAGQVEFATYDAPRAEIANQGKRPEGVGITVAGRIVLAWPTKLVLAPELARAQVDALRESPRVRGDGLGMLEGWTRPDVARPPWEMPANWRRG